MLIYLLQLVAWTVFVAALVLWPAGTLAYPGGWVFIGLFTVGGFTMIVWLARHSPSLLRERMGSPVQPGQQPWDRAWLALFIVGFFAWMAFMGRDAAHTGFAAVPPWLQAVGALGVMFYMVGAWWTFRENVFAAPAVKIQEGQHVIATGPYAIVRHPLYASALFLLIGLPLLLGSWIGLALSPLFMLGVAWRAVHEERVLRAELKGYDEYTKRVRSRVIPFVW